MAGPVFTGVLANTLKKTLNKVQTDKTDGLEASAVHKEWMETLTMEDQWEDDLETAGPGLLVETPEGVEIPAGSIAEGYITRYFARKFGRKIFISEEAMEDVKYPKAIDAARRLKRALWKTVDIDTTNILARGFDTAFPLGDGVPLFSASHPLAMGGVESNTMAVPLAASRGAMIQVRAALRIMKGHDGIREGYMAKAVICPAEQESLWEEILLSTNAPEAGEFNRINVVNRMKLKLVVNYYWSNTTTNWAVQTEADDGPNIRWRRRPKPRTYVENSQEFMVHHLSARWARGVTNWRSMYGVNA